MIKEIPEIRETDDELIATEMDNIAEAMKIEDQHEEE